MTTTGLKITYLSNSYYAQNTVLVALPKDIPTSDIFSVLNIFFADYFTT